jgi:hypothetical protein
MIDKVTFRNWLLAFAATTISVATCIAYVDRPVAEFFDQRLRHTTTWIWIGRALAPLDLVVALALLFLIVCEIWTRSGRSLPLWTRTPLLCCWAALWATVASVALKRFFGRTSPDPAFVQNHLYAFRFFAWWPTTAIFFLGNGGHRDGDLNCDLDLSAALARALY